MEEEFPIKRKLSIKQLLIIIILIITVSGTYSYSFGRTYYGQTYATF